MSYYIHCHESWIPSKNIYHLYLSLFPTNCLTRAMNESFFFCTPVTVGSHFEVVLSFKMYNKSAIIFYLFKPTKYWVLVWTQVIIYVGSNFSVKSYLQRQFTIRNIHFMKNLNKFYVIPNTNLMKLHPVSCFLILISWERRSPWKSFSVPDRRILSQQRWFLVV